MSTSETDLDKALSALRLLTKTCSAAIEASQQTLSDTQSALLATRPTCAVLHKDYLSLLTLLYTSTTKVTLVLRPSAPAPAAALAPICDLATSITSLATCATLFDLYGLTLASEARRLARDVCEAVRALAASFVENAGEDYLVRTGAVHDLIETARRELPADNLAAVKKRWKSDRGMLEDSMEEITGMVEGHGDAEEDLSEDVDDEWDELGFGSSKKMSDVELERTKLVQPLVRFVTLFHKRVVPDVLGSMPSSVTEAAAANAALDALPSLSNILLITLEELTAALYAPQNPDALAAAVAPLVEAIHKVHDAITADIFMPSAGAQSDLEKEMGALRVSDTPSRGGKKAKDSRKWFGTCLAQIDKSAKSVDDMLTTQPGGNTT